MSEFLNMQQAIWIADYVSEEVRRQKDGPLDVGYMLNAWYMAIMAKDREAPLTIKMIEDWAFLIDPAANSHGIRSGPIWIGVERRTEVGLDRRMDMWMGAVNDGYYSEMDYAYKAFEDIHPFNDGNGRTGKIIFNWLNDTLREPTWPINFWGIENP